MEDASPTPINQSLLANPTKTDILKTNISIIEKNKEEIDSITKINKSSIIESMLNMNTSDEMLNDGDLINLQSKYINICWSILAIGTVIFTITNLKK